MLRTDDLVLFPLQGLDDVEAEPALDDRAHLSGLQAEGDLLHLRCQQDAAREPAQVTPGVAGALVLGVLAGQLGEVRPGLNLAQQRLRPLPRVHQDVAGVDLLGPLGDRLLHLLQHPGPQQFRPQLHLQVRKRHPAALQPFPERLLAPGVLDDLADGRADFLLAHRDAHSGGGLLYEHLFYHPLQNLGPHLAEPLLPFGTGDVHAGGGQRVLVLGHLALVVHQVDGLAVDPRGQGALRRGRGRRLRGRETGGGGRRGRPGRHGHAGRYAGRQQHQQDGDPAGDSHRLLRQERWTQTETDGDGYGLYTESGNWETAVCLTPPPPPAAAPPPLS